MLTTVQKWTGREARALREALRASVRDFADHLGISPRMVSKWEAGGTKVHPLPETQAILDTALERSSAVVKARFVALIESAGTNLIVEEAEKTDAADAEPAGFSTQVRSPIDGKRMAKIATGTFLYGEDRKRVWLPDYYIDVTPVTNSEYAVFVEATGYAPPTQWTEGRPPLGLNAHPVVGVSHMDAEAYARWANKVLPTSEEWEKAARGSRGIEFPWGNQRTAAKCNVRETDIGHTTPVTRYHSGISPYGVYDLAGNVWEWCSTETDPDRFVLRGSAFTSSLDMARTPAVNDASGGMLDDDTGFRCACPPSAIEPAQPSRAD